MSRPPIRVLAALMALAIGGCAEQHLESETHQISRALGAVDCQAQGETQQQKDAWCGDGQNGPGQCQTDGTCVCSPMWCVDTATGQCTSPKQWFGNEHGYLCQAPVTSGGGGSSVTDCQTAGETQQLKDAWCGDGQNGLGSCNADGSCDCSTMWCLDSSTQMCTEPKVWGGNDVGYQCASQSNGGGGISPVASCLDGGATQQLRDAWCGDGQNGLGTCNADNECVCSNMWCETADGKCTTQKVWGGNDIGYHCASCTDVEVPNSDYAALGSVSGSVGDVVTVVCSPGYTGGGDWTCGSGGVFTGTACSPDPTSIQLYITGYFSESVSFGSGASASNLTSAGEADVFVQKLDASGQSLWAKGMGGATEDLGFATHLDASGNVYTTGLFTDTGDFDPGPGVTNLTSSGDTDIFVQKLDASGELVWVKSMGGPLADEGFAIHVDAAGNVYTTGRFDGTVDFDPGSGVTNLTSAGGGDIFVQKLDTSGELLWAKRMGSSLNEEGRAILVDDSGNVYTSGQFEGTTDFDPGVGVTNLDASEGSGFFVQKLDADGQFVWAKQIGGHAIRIDDSGNLYATGYFMDTVDFDPGPGVSNLTSAGETDIFVQKLDASGELLWVKRMGGPEEDAGLAIAIDASGNVYTTGQFVGTVDFDPDTGVTNLTSAGSTDAFVQKLDASGQLLWVNRTGGAADEEGYAIQIDALGNVYTIGQFAETVDFDPGTGTTSLTSTGESDIFVQKLDSSGQLIWATNLGGTSNEEGYGLQLFP